MFTTPRDLLASLGRSSCLLVSFAAKPYLLSIAFAALTLRPFTFLGFMLPIFVFGPFCFF
jgi:hypothetical protein